MYLLGLRLGPYFTQTTEEDYSNIKNKLNSRVLFLKNNNNCSCHNNLFLIILYTSFVHNSINKPSLVYRIRR